jgi:hypothetical protein
VEYYTIFKIVKVDKNNKSVNVSKPIKISMKTGQIIPHTEKIDASKDNNENNNLANIKGIQRS